MKRLLLLVVFCIGILQANTQITPTPDKLWGNLFEDVQLNRVFADNKTFVDCIPKYEPAYIMKQYLQEKKKSSFDLKAFVYQYFIIPIIPDVKVTQALL